MHKENKEKNKETDYKRSDPISFQILLIKWIEDLMIITIVIHAYKGILSCNKTTHAIS